MATATIPQLPHDEYAEARREYQDRYANLAAGKRNAQLTSAALMALLALSLALNLVQVHQVKRLPYLVQQDPSGAIVTMVPQLSPSSQVIDLQRIELGVVAQFIRFSRTALSDFAGEDTLLLWVKAHAAGPANKFLGAYYEDGIHNPHLVARKHSVAVTISSIVPIGPHSWQVRFVEQYRDRNGLVIDDEPDSHWVALVHTETSAQPGEDINCPEGVKVVGLQWAREQLTEVQAR
jgi:type IV secretion system protein TrbF